MNTFSFYCVGGLTLSQRGGRIVANKVIMHGTSSTDVAAEVVLIASLPPLVIYAQRVGKVLERYVMAEAGALLKRAELSNAKLCISRV